MCDLHKHYDVVKTLKKTRNLFPIKWFFNRRSMFTVNWGHRMAHSVWKISERIHIVSVYLTILHSSIVFRLRREKYFI